MKMDLKKIYFESKKNASEKKTNSNKHKLKF